jgi:2-dehydro-3-deoxyphosphogluconate aldolase/(4S)-4-hydroxy-2-oxoglutarate aldolase
MKAMRDEIVDRLLDSGAVAVIRMTDASRVVRVAEALAAGGLSAVEITMTVPNAIPLIRTVSGELGDGVTVGVGTVTDLDTARRAVEAGARFVVGPVCNDALLQAAQELEVPVIPGAFTPTEVLRAHEAGAAMVKIFPADVVGPGFVKAILGPMPSLRLMPTGGIDASNAGAWIRAGAVCVGVGGALLDRQAIAEGRYEVVTDRARELIRALRSAILETHIHPAAPAT